MLAHSMDYLRLPIMLKDYKNLLSQYFLLVDKSKKKKKTNSLGHKSAIKRNISFC